MGKLEDNPSINHFSHEHPLSLQVLQSPMTSTRTCVACNGSVSDSFFYTCVSCNFYLHKTCSNIPRTLTHKSDPQHDLVLLSSPAYPEGVFRCNACGSQGSGFSYHCPDCQLDLHIVCASMPPTTNHPAHDHTLGLCFKPPYDDNQGFSCDICKQPGSNEWLYRCNLCEFDAHMKCTMAITTASTSRAILPKSTSLLNNRTRHISSPPPPVAKAILPRPTPIQIYYSMALQSPHVLVKSSSLPPYETHHFSPQPFQPPIQPYYPYVAPPIGVPQHVQSPRQTSFINNMAGHAVEGLVGSVTQEIIQSVFEGMSS